MTGTQPGLLLSRADAGFQASLCEPLGFSAGDANLRRYVGNSPTSATDPSGLIENAPSDIRGQWVQGERLNGTFRFYDTPRNQTAGVANAEIRYSQGYIERGGWPKSWYYGGSVETASVEIAVVLGSRADGTAATAAMRAKLGNPTWVPPKEYVWHHAGGPGSTTMELVEGGPGYRHGTVAHTGSAAGPRAALRDGLNGTACFGNLYMALRFVGQDAGVLQPDYVETPFTYYFVDANDAVYHLQKPGLFGFYYPRRIYDSGPRKGECDVITNEDYAKFVAEAEAKWGRYIPGSLLWSPRFIPGTMRATLPLTDQWGREIGYVDENGVHNFSDAEIGQTPI